jgi:hypothetical protein
MHESVLAALRRCRTQLRDVKHLCKRRGDGFTLVEPGATATEFASHNRTEILTAIRSQFGQTMEADDIAWSSRSPSSMSPGVILRVLRVGLVTPPLLLSTHLRVHSFLHTTVADDS